MEKHFLLSISLLPHNTTLKYKANNYTLVCYIYNPLMQPEAKLYLLFHQCT